MKQRLLPKNDKIFKIIFGRKENSWIFKEFVHDLIGIEVNEVTYLDPTKIFSIRHSKEEEVKKKTAPKTRIVDILMEINNQTMLTLEMQVRKTNYFLERIMLYIFSLLPL
ncbi:PD-(D/E)XK nuclease family transposase [Xylocopilactobacillus apicola]|uniref:Transposase (putative) YhgA-like domain-containing protein n=1 Tax=Xylocopilactobacillus apicola TaxID=2932184 RepID=A0AAU9D9L7_9LACO|nr:PD-(D/E)XK nuclease family transposase [Xylocopilactobacillus apicola]BDR59111.1 hypothetical protein XA3_15520 [Xylocopilactobacillus apicola]